MLRLTLTPTPVGAEGGDGQFADEGMGAFAIKELAGTGLPVAFRLGELMGRAAGEAQGEEEE